MISLALAFPCLDVGFSIAENDAKERKALESFVRNGFEPEIPGIQADGKVLIDNVIKRFGEPVVTRNKTVDDGEEVTLEYAGLTIQLWRNGQFPTKMYWSSTIKLTSPQYRLKYGLGIGQPKAAFLEVLGPPNDPEAPEYYRYKDQYKDKRQPLGYEVGGDESQHFVVFIYFDDNNVATRIIWSPPGTVD